MRFGATAAAGRARRPVRRASVAEAVRAQQAPAEKLRPLTPAPDRGGAVDAPGRRSYPRPRIEVLAESDPKIARELRDIAFKALSRMQTQLLILGRITALEKVGSF